MITQEIKEKVLELVELYSTYSMLRNKCVNEHYIKGYIYGSIRNFTESDRMLYLYNEIKSAKKLVEDAREKYGIEQKPMLRVVK